MPAGRIAFKILRAQLRAHPFNLRPRRPSRSVSISCRAAWISLLRRLPHLLQRLLALRVPLLQLLLARLEDLGLRTAQLVFVRVVSASAAAIAPRACSTAPVVRARRSASTRPADDAPACRTPHQQDKKNHRRHRAEHKFTELIQYLVHELGSA